MRDPVGDLRDAHGWVEHGLVDAVAPGERLVGGLAVERVESAGIGAQRRLVGEEAFADQPPPVAAHDRRHVGEREFRVILHAPRDRAVDLDLGRLHAANAR